MPSGLALFLLASLAVLAGAFAADHYARHGVGVRYQAFHHGEWLTVTSTVEHRVQFENEHRALGRYVQGWDYDTHGIPTELPRFRIVLRGRLHLPGPRSWKLRAQTGNAAVLTVDGERDPERITPGDHDLRVVWTGRFEERHPPTELITSLRIIGSNDGQRWNGIPASWISPAWTDDGDLTIVWGSAALLWLFLCVPLFFAWIGSPEKRGRRLGVIALAAILALGLGLRLFDYSIIPQFQENGDELFATWNGWSLLDDGTPRGWSLWHHIYGGRVQHEALPYWTSFGGGWHIITPYFEHPPLAHLLVGAAAKLGGATHFAHSRFEHTRLVPIGLSIVTMLLMFMVGRKLDDERTGAPWLAVLLYAALPLLAIQNRVIKEEILLAPMALGSLYLFLRWREGASDRWIIAAAFVAGTSCLAKVTGAVFVPALLILVASTGKWRAFGKAALAGGVGIGLLFLYGAVIDWDVFFFTTFHQATGRPAHFNLFPRFIADGLIIHNLVYHGPILFLWLSTVGGLGGRGRRIDPAYIVFPMTYLVAIAVSSGNWMFGWYMLPIYPFLCLGSGLFLVELWRRPNPLHGVLFVGLLVMYGFNFVADEAAFKSSLNQPTIRLLVSIFVVVMMGPYFLVMARPWPILRRLAQGVMVLGLAFFVVLSANFVVRYEVLYETHNDFDRDHFFDR